ncbi:MAG: hypothetical protein K2H06_05135 [Anaeroplasmataceae bacterium]|nr:hypothetical protein [Anaeroplasmataceae bacterium]
MISITVLHKEEYEAEIVVKNNDYELLCYCPSNVNDLKEINLHTMLSKNIVKSEVDTGEIVKLDAYFAYKLCCKVIDFKEQLVALGEIKIYLDSSLPGDVKNGDFVEFEVMRLDIF